MKANRLIGFFLALFISTSSFSGGGDLKGKVDAFFSLDADKNNFVDSNEFSSQARDSFNGFDANKDGRLSPDEASIFINLIASKKNKKKDLQQDVLKDIFEQIDVDKDGSITFGEFYSFRSDDFSRLDVDGDDKISRAEAQIVFIEKNEIEVFERFLAGSKVSDAEKKRRLDNLMAHVSARRSLFIFDRNKDGFITIDEFDHDYRIAFSHIDSNRDGFITMEELKANYELARIQMPLGSVQVADYDEINASRFFREFDSNNDGKISLGEYRSKSVAEFRSIDTNGDGKISNRELLRSELMKAQ